jgi:hypothetical protein
MFETQPHLPVKRAREESDPESDCEENSDITRAIMEEMDFQPTQHTQHMTETQAIGDTGDIPVFGTPQMPLPLNPEHAAIRADFEIITASAMEQLYQRIIANVNASVAEHVAAASLKTNGKLRHQVSLLNSRIT